MGQTGGYHGICCIMIPFFRFNVSCDPLTFVARLVLFYVYIYYAKFTLSLCNISGDRTDTVLRFYKGQGVS